MEYHTDPGHRRGGTQASIPTAAAAQGSPGVWSCSRITAAEVGTWSATQPVLKPTSCSIGFFFSCFFLRTMMCHWHRNFSPLVLHLQSVI